MADNQRVVIVGGGIIGCSIAYFLAKEGIAATVLEQGQIGGAAAAAAAGILAPLAETPLPNPFLNLALAGLSMFDDLEVELREASGIDIGYNRSGILRVAPDETEALILRQRQGWQAELGYHLEWVGPEAIAGLEPGISPDIVGGLYSPAEGSVDAPRLVQAYARAATRAGAVIREGAAVEGLIREGDRLTGVQLADGRLSFDRLVFTAGAWTARWSAAFGVPIPVFPVRGQVAALGGLEAGLRHIVYSGKNYLVPKPDGTVIIGATQEESGFDARVTLGGIAYLAAAAEKMVPGLAGASVVRTSAGLRPGSADGWPLLGPLPDYPEVIVASGHFRNGILLSGITGQVISDLIARDTAEIDLTPFRPDRFVEAATP